MSDVELQPVNGEHALPAEPSQPQAVVAQAPRKPASTDQGWSATVQSLASTIVIAVFVITFLVQAFQIPSESMENTLLIGDYLLVDKVHFANSGGWSRLLPYDDIRRGDIIVFRFPVHPEQHFVKRVVGIPGDLVRLVNKQVYVNGKRVEEPYALHQSNETDSYRDDFPQPDLPSPSLNARWWTQMRGLVTGGQLRVPPDSYFVLGDNRDFSLDSRYWGFVPRANIIGRPLLIYLSLRTPASDADPQVDGKISHAGVFSQWVHLARWQRTFQIVK